MTYQVQNHVGVQGAEKALVAKDIAPDQNVNSVFASLSAPRMQGGWYIIPFAVAGAWCWYAALKVLVDMLL